MFKTNHEFVINLTITIVNNRLQISLQNETTEIFLPNNKHNKNKYN